ncbi:MAG: SEC-C metal-binding domain-containing protein [Planctomycetota bacterium]
MSPKIGRNEPCPCGSGKKFKQCCYGREFDSMVTDVAKISSTSSTMDEDDDSEFEEEAFLNELGYDLSDPEMLKFMQEAGLDPSKIEEFLDSGLLNEMTEPPELSPAELERWTTIFERFIPDEEQPLPKMSWTKAEWEQVDPLQLDEFQPFWDYLELIQDDLEENSERTDRYFRLIEAIMVVDSNTDLKLVNDAWLAEQMKSVVIDRPLLLKFLRDIGNPHVQSLLGDLEACEFTMFAVDFATSQQSMLSGDAEDEELDKLAGTVVARASMNLYFAINRELGIDDEDEISID